MTNIIRTPYISRGPLAVELVTLAYTLFTTLLILVFWQRMGNPLALIEGRAMVVAGMALLWCFYRLRPHP